MSSYMELNQKAGMDTHAAVRHHLLAHMDTRGWR